MNKRRLVLPLLAAVLLFCPGCWSYREISSTTFVSGAAVDLDPLGGYILTAEIIDFSQTTLESGPKSSVITTRGATIAEAADNIMRSVGEKPYWSHAAAFIVSRDAAEAGITPLLDFMMNNIDTCLTASVLVSALPTAQEVFELKSVENGVISYEIRSILEENADYSQTISDFVYTVIGDLASGGVCAALPTVSSYEQNEERFIDIAGCALFDGDRMVSQLDAYETARLLALRNRLGEYTLDVRLSDGNLYTLRLLRSETARRPVRLDDGTLRVCVDVKADTVVTSAPSIDMLTHPASYVELERAAEAKITDELSGLISRLQQSGLDAPGFGTLFSKSMPEVYAPLSADWGQAFRTLDVVVSADVRVTKSSAGPAILTPSG